MPELPEVENAAARLRAATVGATLSRVRAVHPSQKRTLTPTATRPLIGGTVVAVTRRAKLQLVALDSGHTIEIHFRMNGDWDIGTVDDEPPKHERVRFEFTDGTRVSLVDSRALSVLKVHKPGALALPDFGPEPLDAAWTADQFISAIKPKRGPIKPLLLDQRIVSGLGNIYAAEALWEARIDPRTAAGSISKVRATRLHTAIGTVLRRAPAGRYYLEGGKISDDGARRVYGRAGEPCVRCGKPIKRIVQAGRSTFWCSGCQT